MARGECNDIAGELIVTTFPRPFTLEEKHHCVTVWCSVSERPLLNNDCHFSFNVGSRQLGGGVLHANSSRLWKYSSTGKADK